MEDPRNTPPEAEVGITNRDIEVEQENLERQEKRKRAQMRGDSPIGTHEGTTLDEQEQERIHDIDPGTEAERGADRATE